MTPFSRQRRPRPILKSRIRVAASQIRLGMFVIELDRPWSETPFLIQGFLINAIDDLDLMRSLCLEVVIDPRRSATESLSELINLYDLPEEPQAKEPHRHEQVVRVRYVQHDALRAPSSSRKMWPDMERLRETVTKGFWGLAQSRALDKAMAAPRRGVKPAEPDDAVRLPRFSRSQIRYVQSPEPAPPSTKEPQARIVAWEKRKSRMARQPSADDSSILDRLATFEEIINSLKPDVAGFFRGLVPAGGKIGNVRAIKWRLPKFRARTFTSAQSDELSIPKFIDLIVYRDRVGIESEVARAREAMTLAEDTLSSLKSDAAREGVLRVDGLPNVVEALVESVERNADAMIWVSRVRLNNSTAYSHSIKVASYLLAFGRHLGFPQTELIQLAHIGLLMDIGKLELDPQLVNKTAALSQEEFVELQRHVDLGLTRLEATMHLPRAVFDGIAQHHEWIDGSGYPAGLSGEQIGIYGRMAAIADMYAALTTHRPYAPTMSSYDALQLMYARAHAQLHGPLVEQFVRAIGLYPVGSLVLLNTEEVAVVTALDKVQRLEPRVLVLTGPDKNTLERPFELDLVRSPKDANGNRIKILRSLPAGVHNIDFRNFYIA